VLVAHDLTGLRGKLADAEAEKPPDLPAPGVAQPAGVDIGRVPPARLIALGKIIRPPSAHPPSSHHNAGGRECLATEAEVGGLPGCRATVR